MVQMQLDIERLQQVPEQYRQQAALHAELKQVRRAHTVRRGFASALRRLADALEPATPTARPFARTAIPERTRP